MQIELSGGTHQTMPSIVRIVLSARARVPVLVRVRFELILIPVMVEYHDGGEVMADLSPWLKTATGVTDEHMEEASVILRGTDWDACSLRVIVEWAVSMRV